MLSTRRLLVYRPISSSSSISGPISNPVRVAGQAGRLSGYCPARRCLSFLSQNYSPLALYRSFFVHQHHLVHVRPPPSSIASLWRARGLDTTRPALPASSLPVTSLGVSVIRQLQSCASLLSQHPVSWCPSHASSFPGHPITLRFIASVGCCAALGPRWPCLLEDSKVLVSRFLPPPTPGTRQLHRQCLQTAGTPAAAYHSAWLHALAPIASPPIGGSD